MIEYLIGIISIILSLILVIQILVNLILARKNDSKENLRKSRIQFVILLVVFIIYGIIRNII